MSGKMLERYSEAQDFLIDTRSLPMELRWKISGMVEAANVFNFNNYATGDTQPSASQQARSSA